jgi:predicted GIY-YIG superfamily endonuclease
VNPTVSLYRFYNSTGELLYIGITNRIPRRLDEHGDEKPWYLKVADVKVEHHPDRHAALAAEKSAIKTERPKYNVVHNRGRHLTAAPSQDSGQWTFRSLRSGYEFRKDLVLYPELDCSAMVDDVYELDGEGQLEEYVQYLERRHPEWLAADAVPIVWSVHSNWHGVFEAAPFAHSYIGMDFLTHFTWPEDAATGEPLDWYALPVVNDRFPEFAKALAWTPSPLQPTCPLASIVRSRNGQYAMPRAALPRPDHAPTPATPSQPHDNAIRPPPQLTDRSVAAAAHTTPPHPPDRTEMWTNDRR